MNVSHRSERIAVSLSGNKNRNKDTVTPDSFLDLFPGNRTPSICLLLFSPVFLSRHKEVMIL